MRRNLVGRPATIAMNFKMYFDHLRTIQWCEQAREIALNSVAIRDGHAQLVVFPSFPSIAAVVEIFAGTGIQVGAQNMSHVASGAFTGEVSAASLKQVGCEYIEIGHAERRNLFGETHQQIQEKMSLAAAHKLTPLLCVGEPQPSTPDAAAKTCIDFIEHSVSGLDPEAQVRAIIAYEPQWAIGAQQAADHNYIQEVSNHLTTWLGAHEQLSQSDLIYGGSAGPGLYAELNGAVSGLFLGRHAHDPNVLARILNETVA